MQYLAFYLNDVEYAVDVRIVRSVVEYAGETAVPSALPYLRGVMDLRGDSVPLLDLRKKLCLPARETDHGACVLVFSREGDRDDRQIGALVDGVSGVVELPEDEDVRDSHTELGLWERFVKGISRLDGRTVVRISPEGLFSEQDLELARDR